MLPSAPSLTPSPDPPWRTWILHKETAHNPLPAAHLHAAPRFRLCRAIDAKVEKGVDNPLVGYGNNFCLSYHFKGV